MKKISFLLTALLVVFTASAQELNQVKKDRKSDKDMLVGYCDREGLEGEVFGEYFEDEYRTYEPDIEVIKNLRTLPGTWQATVVLASWCSDTQREVPRFYRIMAEAGFDEDDVELIAVDRKKKAGDVDIEELEVERVPTFIFYKDGKEIGRIIERPKETLEKDMLLILARPPKPSAPGQ